MDEKRSRREKFGLAMGKKLGRGKKEKKEEKRGEKYIDKGNY
jgi:hypothetical protein